MSRLSILLPIILIIALLSFGCLSSIGSFGCGFVSDGHDKDECFQAAAVAATDASLCDKITGAGFTGSDPPKDKCFLRVANETNDASLCSRMVGGMYSYEPSECYYDVAINTGDTSLCDNVPAFDGSYDTMNINKASCIAQAKASPKYKGDEGSENTTGENTSIENSTNGETNSTTGAEPSTPPAQTPPQPTSSTTAPSSASNSPDNSATSPPVTLTAPKTTRLGTPIIDPPKTDEDKTAAITDSGTTPSDPSKLSDKTSQILVNLPSADKSSIASANADKTAAIAATPVIPAPPPETAKPDDEEGYLAKGWNWLTWGADKTHEVYEGAGDEAPKGTGALGTAGDVTEGIKDVGEIQDSFNGVNKKIESGEITGAQGKLLKVGYGLGKAIKWTAKNVPIVGDAVGDAADGAFSTGMKAGEKIAAATTKTNKCIDDPLSDDCVN